MRIAFIHDVLYPFVTGGAEHRAYELFTRLAKSHEVHLFTMHWEGMPSWNFNHQGIKVHCVCQAPVKKDFYTKGRRAILPAIKFSLSLLPALLKHDFDVIDCDEFPFLHVFPAKIYSLIKRAPLFITFHEWWSLRYWLKYTRLGLLGYLVQSLTKRLGRVTCVSSKTRELVGRGVVIPNGLDVELINSVKSIRNPYSVMTAGRLIPEKNVDKLIKAFNELNKGTLTVLGEGPELGRLKSLAGKRVKFLKFLKNHEDVIALMKAHQVYASMSEREGFGMTILEARACNCVTLDFNDFKDKNPARALNESFSKKPERINLKVHDWNLIAKNLLKVYESGVKRSS